MGGEIAGAALGGIFGAFTSGINNQMAQQRERLARAENHQYAEIEAQNADKRTRALYDDYLTPAAQMRMIKEAGLSPSLMFGGGGASGASMPNGAQANSTGIAPQVFGVNAAEAAQIGLMLAQTEKTKAETKNVEANTTGTELENDVKKLENTQFKNEWTLINTTVYNEDGSESSLYELAENSYDYDQFLNKVRDAAKKSERTDILETTETEAGQAVLRGIYTANAKFERDIAELSRENVDAKFYQEITQELQKEDFAKLNAQEQVADLRKNISDAELDQAQKDAWLRILKKLEHAGGTTTKDVAIVLGIILDRALSNWKLSRPKAIRAVDKVKTIQ